MITFGYGRNRLGWSDARKENLRIAFTELIESMTEEGKFNNIPEEVITQPGIEYGYNNGIEIVGFSHMKLEVRDELVERAEAIYHNVMALQKKPKK